MNKYSEELKLLENKKVKQIILAAREEFSEKGIIYAKLKDIAKRAKVGEATLYRNFADKRALAKLVAFDYWMEKSTLHFEFNSKYVTEESTSLDKVRIYLGMFKELYINHAEFLKFMEDFDNYMMNLKRINEHDNYEDMIMAIKEQFRILVKNGIEDGSIRDDITPDEMYQFVAQVMVSTTQKLAMRVGYLESDEGIEPLNVLDNLIDMFCNYIKK